MKNIIRADAIAYQAFDSRQKGPKHDAGAFSMYSYDRFASLIIEGIALQMLDDGCTEQQIKNVLASKHIRWGLDDDEELFMEMGKEFAKKHNLSVVANEMSKE